MRSSSMQLPSWPLFWNWDEEEALPTTSSNIEIYETTNEVIVEANLPGVSEKEIDLTFEKGILWIRTEADKREETKKTERKYFYKTSRDYSYKIDVPGNIDLFTEPKASLAQGVLTVVFKKAEALMPKHIAVKRLGQK